MRKYLLYLAVALVSISLTGCSFFDPEPDPPPPGGWGYVAISGVVRDVRNNPVAGARVYTFQNNEISNIVYSIADGTFNIKRALVEKNRSFRVLASKLGYQDCWSEPYNFFINENYNTASGNIWLYKPNDYSVVTYRGYVRDSAGNPIENATVTINFLTAMSSGSSVSCVTGPDGYYNIEDFLPKAPSQIEFRVGHSVFHSYSSSDTLVVHDGVYEKDFVLYHSTISFNITGKTVNQEGIGLASDIVLTGYCRDPFTIIIPTNPDGSYLVQGIAIERYTYLTVTAIKTGFQDDQQQVLIEENYTYNLEDLVLIPKQ